ncbi:e3 ubiquitin-protein ligase zswim2 [Fusarium langsethiae]|uniref:E3 ubiquitin-protein ligase zswim2 n=1 Tax=Fusarium langsethiae TaxID=179993 RepID=A0A0N0V6Z0_FUSLA|nr:e3 ubiquitin-protein ligase zswim2 [Fusarium langsethiae]GKT98164.1 unnamed protein product [Fusarium langsethiae]GKU19956.1 unnamed protein product [Fusarium langsethiae]
METRVLRSSTRRSNAPENVVPPQKKVSRKPTNKTSEAGQTTKSPISLHETMTTPQPASRKRKVSQLASEHESPQVKKETKPMKQKKEKENAEKRERRFRNEPPQSFHSVYGRALSERFYVLERTRCGTEACPEEDFEMTGSTGNIYTVHIGKRLKCTCPHHTKGVQQCKHIVFIMKKVLNAPFDLVYQLALISTELQSVFASAPSTSSSEQEKSDKRKPIEGDCPICYCELDGTDEASIVWCAATCGHNFHKDCFEIWAKTKHGNVTCPLCRSDWKGDESLVATVQKDKAQVDDGYLNVSDQLGISRERDTSTYSRWFEYHQNGGRWNPGFTRRNEC